MTATNKQINEFDKHMASDDDFKDGDVNAVKVRWSDKGAGALHCFPVLDANVSPRATILLTNSTDEDYIDLSPLMAERFAYKILEAIDEIAKEAEKQAKKNLDDDDSSRRDDGLVC